MKYKLINKEIKKDYLNQFLTERGVTNIDGFLNPTKEFLQNPEDLTNIQEAAFKFLAYMQGDSKILTVVDADVDGFTSSAIIYQYIKKIKPEADIDFILHEHKGHGLSDLIDDILNGKKSYDLIIIPDAGSNDYQYIEMLKETKSYVIILDHHIINEDTQISDNCTIVNNQMSPNYKNKDLTGAGVTWQFCRMVDKMTGYSFADEFIDLAALGIISDMGSILSLENRYIIEEGLKNIKNFFFESACQKQDYSMGGRKNYISVAFYITPLLNSLIRVGSQPEKERLFMAMIDGHQMVPCNKRGAKGTFEKVAIESLRECTNTKSKQDKITTQAMEQLNVKIFNNNLLDNKVLFVELEDEDDFPQEVNGLVAMKLSAHHKHPTLLGRLNSEGDIKGSIRGLNNSDMGSFRDMLLGSGLFEYVSGHDGAAGFSIPKKNIDKLMEYSNSILSDVNFNEDYYDVNFVRYAADKDIPELILDLGKRPDIWGQNNKEPYIYISDINLKKSDIQIIGARKDTVKFEKFGVVYIKFFAKDLIAELENYDEIKMEVVGKANINEWGGRLTPQIMIENYELKSNEYGF